MRIFKKIFKITGIVIGVLLIGLFIAAHILLQPSSDEKALEKLANSHHPPHIYYNTYKKNKYRVITMQQRLDTLLPTLVFVHGSPGSALDYQRYFKDSLLNMKANIIGYDRIGYGPGNAGNVQGSIAFELEILHDVIKGIPPEKIVLVGYSYGGPIVLASPKPYKYKVSLASAVEGKLEPMFWMLHFYKWKLTRPLIPSLLKAAAKEKYSHLSDLPKYENQWNISTAPIINIQGDKDRIVPYENSMILQQKIDVDKFTMVTIKNGGHGLVWVNFDLIKNEILKTLQ